MALREVRLRPSMPTDGFIRRQVIRFLAAGDDVCVRYVMRNREATRARVESLMASLTALVEDVGAEVVEPPRNNMRSVAMTIRPRGEPRDGAGSRVPLRPRPRVPAGGFAEPEEER